MHRDLGVIIALAVVVTGVGSARAGGAHHHGHESAYWWTLGAGVALGTLGAIVARPAPVVQPYPLYPPVGVTPPRTVVHWYCPVYGTYYPTVPACPVPWVHVYVPYERAVRPRIIAPAVGD
jgi:hypothetical protein